MESFGFELRLIDSINSVAAKAAQNLRNVDQAAQRTTSTLNNQLGKAFEKIGLAASRAAYKNQQAFATMWSKIGVAAAKDQERASIAATKSQEKALAQAEKVAKAQERAAKDMRKQRQEQHNQTSYTSDVKRAQDQLRRLRSDPEGYKRLLKVQREIAETQEKYGKTSFFKDFGKAFKERTSLGRLIGAEAIGSLIAEGIIKAGEILIETAKKVVEIVVDGFREALRNGSKEQNVRLGYRLSLGDKGGDSKSDFERIEKIAGFYGIDEQGLPLRRAGFDQQGSRTALAIAHDLAAGSGKGGDQGFISGILDTLTDIKLKGGVGEKRLVSMGVNAPDFYKSLAQRLGTSTDTAKERAAGGKVDPQLIINEIGRAIERRQGMKLGMGGIEYGKTMEARLNKLKSLPEEYLESVVAAPGFERLSEKVGHVLEMLDPDSERGQRIVAALIRAFDRIADMIGAAFTPENIEAFSKALIQIVEDIGKLAEKVMPLLEAYHKYLPYGEMAYKVSSAPLRAIGAIGSGVADLFNSTDSIANITPENAAQVVAARQAGSIRMDVTNDVKIYAQPGEDPTHTHQRAAEESGRQMADQARRALQQAGG